MWDLAKHGPRVGNGRGKRGFSTARGCVRILLKKHSNRQNITTTVAVTTTTTTTTDDDDNDNA
jgi:hypothetical protein